MTTRRLRLEAQRRSQPTKANLIYHLGNANEELKARSERIAELEEALRKIASNEGDVVAIARAALAKTQRS